MWSLRCRYESLQDLELSWGKVTLHAYLRVFTELSKNGILEMEGFQNSLVVVMPERKPAN